MIVFLAVLAADILLTLIDTPASALVTITTALSGLYQAWNARRLPPQPHGPAPAGGNQDLRGLADANRQVTEGPPGRRPLRHRRTPA